MIVEPVPTNSPSRRRRALARLALAVPVLLLVAVAGVGRPRSHPGRRRRGPAVLATPGANPRTPRPQPTPATASVRPPVDIPNVLRRPPRQPFPVAIDGLAVQSVPQALAGPAIDRARARSSRSPATSACRSCPRTAATGSIRWARCASGRPCSPSSSGRSSAAQGSAGSDRTSTRWRRDRGPAPERGRAHDDGRRAGRSLTAVLVGRFGGFLTDGCTEPDASAARPASSSTRWPGPRAARSPVRPVRRPADRCGRRPTG